MTKNRLLTLFQGTIVLLFIALFSIIVYFVYFNNSSHANKQVCLKLTEYNRLLQMQSMPHIPQQQHSIAQERDVRVLKDPLFPAINRSETDVHNSVIHAIDKKQLYNRTQEYTDQYRMVAYVTNPDDKKDSGGNTWKLIARQRNRNQGDFYLIPANNNYDMKIMLTNDIVVGNEKLRDIYTVPKTLTFKSPLLNETPYEVTELPMGEITDLYQ